MPNNQDLYVNTQTLHPTDTYVCWIDIMGTKNAMSNSFEQASNHILRFHACCIKATKDIENTNIRVYPLMDGIFLTSAELQPLREVINRIYEQLSELFINAVNFRHKFVIRGALAYGQISHGEEVDNPVNPDIASNDNYKKQLLFGLPMIQSFKSENNAPPFGLYIHESARIVGQLQGRYFQWLWDDSERRLSIKESLNQYFDWCKDHHNQLDIEINKIEKYKELIDEYFSD
jgi:hypothetical protein